MGFGETPRRYFEGGGRSKEDIKMSEGEANMFNNERNDEMRQLINHTSDASLSA